MRIGIDCRLSGAAHAGIGRYIENLLIRLPQQNAEIDWVFFFYDQQQYQLLLDSLPVKIAQLIDQVERRYLPVRHYTLAEQFLALEQFTQAKLDVLHVPHFNVPILYRGKLVVTIHDLLWHQYRGSRVTTLTPIKYWLKYRAYKLVVALAVRKAQQILVPANTIKQTLLQYYPHIDQKVTVTKEGADLRLKPSKERKRQASQLLYVGSLYPHKNIDLVIKALQHLPDWQLVVAGARNIFQQQTQQLAEHQGVAKQVKFLGYVPDTELAKLLTQCTALVQPSFSEGFGLTGLEALAAQTPVIASDIPIFKEIYQQAAQYFDPGSVASFLATLKSLPTTPTQKWLKLAQAVVNQYSWDTMVEQTVAAYHKA